MEANTIAGFIASVLGCVLIEYDSENPCGIGWTYNPETGKFAAPLQPDEEAPAVE